MMLLGSKPIGTVAYMGGVPAVLEAFCWSWGQMVQYNQEMLCSGIEYVHYDRATISDHAPARNGLTGRFLGDWLVQMDTDHSFDPDIVGRLVGLADYAGVDVLSAVYHMKTAPHPPVLFQWQNGGLQPMATWPNDVPVLEIGSAGGGCLFVRRSVYDRLAAAYPGEGAFDRIHPFSEDHSFFKRCHDQGIKTYAAMQVHSAHLRVAPITTADYDLSGVVQSERFAVEGFA